MSSSVSIFEKAKLLASIQDVVECLSESNYNECLSLISKSPLFSTDVSSISRIIYFASRVRPFSIPLLVRLVFDLSEQSPAFKQAMIDDLFSRQYSNIGRYYFLYKCYEKGLFTIDLVSNTLSYLFVRNLISSAVHLYIWFAPELEKNFPDQFNRIRFPDGEEFSEMNDELRSFWVNYEKLKVDDWKLLKERREAGINDNPKILTFLNDDVEALKIIIQSENENQNSNNNDETNNENEDKSEDKSEVKSEVKSEDKKHGFDPNERIKPSCYDRCSIFLNSPTLLCCAAYLKAEKICRYLIEIGADVKLSDKAMRTPMIMAVAGGASEELLRIVSNPESDDHVRAVLVSASNHRNDYIQKVISTENYVELHQNTFGGILHQAAGTNNIRAGLFCLDCPNPVDVNNPNQFNETPLHYASLYGNVSFIQLLLSFPNIDVNALTVNHQAPIHLAMNSFSHQSALSLMNHPKIDPFIPDKEENDNNVVHYAAKNDYFDIFEMIFTKYPDTDVNMPNKHQRTPLHIALMYSAFDIVRYLLKNPKTDVNYKDQMDRTPMHVAVLLMNREIIELLLKCPGIDLSIQEMHKMTPLDYAERIKYQEGVDILKPLTPPPPPETEKKEEENNDNDNSNNNDN